MKLSSPLFVLPMLGLLLCPIAAGAAEDVPYGVAKARWPEALGNHRARVEVKEKADALSRF